ncbi:hypothetical protein AB0J80_25200 [Actinoplanes sp. NPDC049548]|uniref:hypothetical protein n=1 Tax=Actinoplanes sp. NPDC049548 TaxID=3155152 RepID=UPI003420965B
MQRGLGRGAYKALHDPAGPDEVLRCLRRDYRWYWMVDDRAVYLARLVRDLAVPVPLLVDVVNEDDDHDNAFGNVLDVLEALGRAGDAAAVDGLRRYVGQGPRWVDVLQTIACAWPVELWDDLLPTARARLPHDAQDRDLLWNGEPWRRWATSDERIAAEVAADSPRPLHRPYANDPAAALLTLVRTGDADRQRAALRELNRRGPAPEVLALLADLPLERVAGDAGHALDLLGTRALPLARQWAAVPGHPMFWRAHLLLAAHGDESDVPALLAGWEWLDSREEDLCGYDALAAGLARIGGPAAPAVVRPLRRAWFSPHSYERAAYLRALLELDPDSTDRLLTEGLWDCESDVRLIAAGLVPLDPLIERRLREMSADPLETPEVRAAAAARAG